MNVTLDFALKTHAGLVRPLNEDAIGADPACGLFVLADGLGGYNAGEIASVMAVSAVLDRLSSALARLARERGARSRRDQVMYDTVSDINGTIYHAALQQRRVRGHGHDARDRLVPRRADCGSRTPAIRGCTGTATASSSS